MTQATWSHKRSFRTDSLLHSRVAQLQVTVDADVRTTCCLRSYTGTAALPTRLDSRSRRPHRLRGPHTCWRAGGMQTDIPIESCSRYALTDREPMLRSVWMSGLSGHVRVTTRPYRTWGVVNCLTVTVPHTIPRKTSTVRRHCNNAHLFSLRILDGLCRWATLR